MIERIPHLDIGGMADEVGGKLPAIYPIAPSHVVGSVGMFFAVMLGAVADTKSIMWLDTLSGVGGGSLVGEMDRPVQATRNAATKAPDVTAMTAKNGQ